MAKHHITVDLIHSPSCAQITVTMLLRCVMELRVIHLMAVNNSTAQSSSISMLLWAYVDYHVDLTLIQVSLPLQHFQLSVYQQVLCC